MNDSHIERTKKFARSEFLSLLFIAISYLFILICAISNLFPSYLAFFLALSGTIIVFFRFFTKYRIAKNENNECWPELWLYICALMLSLGILAEPIGLGIWGIFLGVFLTVLAIASLSLGYVTQKYWIALIYKLDKFRKSSKERHYYLSTQRSDKRRCLIFPVLLPVAISSFVISVFKLDILTSPIWIFVAALPSFAVTILIMFVIWGLKATGLMAVKLDRSIDRFEDGWISYFNGFTIESWLAYGLYLIISSNFGFRQEGFSELPILLLASFIIFGLPYLFVARCYTLFFERRNSGKLVRYFSEKYGLKNVIAHMSISEAIVSNTQQE